MEDLNNIKEFDAPNETAYRNQASVSEGEIFTAGRSLASKTSVDAGAAAKTVPTGKPLAKIQDLSLKSQTTDAQPSSTVLATAQSKPPLIRGSIISSIGFFNLVSFSIYLTMPLIPRIMAHGPYLTLLHTRPL